MCSVLQRCFVCWIVVDVCLMLVAAFVSVVDVWLFVGVLF